MIFFQKNSYWIFSRYYSDCTVIPWFLKKESLALKSQELASKKYLKLKILIKWSSNYDQLMKILNKCVFDANVCDLNLIFLVVTLTNAGIPAWRSYMTVYHDYSMTTVSVSAWPAASVAASASAPRQ